jgi:hypothetical protein
MRTEVLNLLGEAKRLSAAAEGAKDLRTAIAGLREVRGVLELVASRIPTRGDHQGACPTCGLTSWLPPGIDAADVERLDLERVGDLDLKRFVEGDFTNLRAVLAEQGLGRGKGIAA